MKEYYAYHYQYNMAITCTWPKYKLTLVALFKSVNLFCEKNMSDYWINFIKVKRKPTGFGGRLTVFRNNWKNTALVYRQGSTLAVARWPGATRNWCRATKLLKKSHFGGPIGQLKFQSNDVMRITSNGAECYCHSFSMLKTNTWHIFLVSYGTQCYRHSFLSPPFFSGH